MCFDKICVRCCKMYVAYSKIKFITNITNVIRIHTFYFYNNKHIYHNGYNIYHKTHNNNLDNEL